MINESKVYRLFIEKRDVFDIESKNLLADLRDNLGVKEIDSLRLINRYDIQGLTEDEFDAVRDYVLGEPYVDDVYDENFSVGDECRVLTVEYLPGQYDQRADITAQTIQFLTLGELPIVKNARLICLQNKNGKISDELYEKIKNHIVNPVESRIATDVIPESLEFKYNTPEKTPRIDNFIKMNSEILKEYLEDVGYAMSFEDLEFCQQYFRDKEKRDPTTTELKVIDTYWSDHCRHTTFFTELENIEIEKSPLTKIIEDALEAYHDARKEVFGDKVDERYISLMDMATIGMRLLKKRGQLSDLDESDEVNACSIKVPIAIDGKVEEWLIQFKNETHNHPTEIEPFGGASTCLGGAIRDPLSGRAYVYQAMRITGSGDPLAPYEKTMESKLPTRQITTVASEGYSSYGNQIGLSAGYVKELYDYGYVAKRMEMGALVGACPASNVIREKPVSGDVIILVGGKTGRDGCGGATGSSRAHTTDSIEECSAEVQKGNPLIERNIQRLFRDPKVASTIKKCNDFGAGGVSVAIGELADGLDVNLDKIPAKYGGLNGTELAISESQERMAVVLDPKHVEAFKQAADKENLEATVVAVVTDKNRLVLEWEGDVIVDLSRDFLDTNGVTQKSTAYITAPKEFENYYTNVPSSLSVDPIEDAFRKNLKRLKVASQKGLIEKFDSTAGAIAVNKSLSGKYKLTPEEAMVAKVPVLDGETDDATAMSYGFIPGISRWSPFHGAAFAVTQSLARLASVGAPPFSARLSFQEYFEALREDPKRWGKPTAALLGGFLAQEKFGVPSIGGKDSMSGSFDDLDVPPTLISVALSMTKASATGSAVFKKSGSIVAFLPLPLDTKNTLPDWEKTKELYNKVSKLIRDGEITAASVIDDGGVAAAVSRMAFGNKIGFSFTSELSRKELFSPLTGSFVVELKEGDMILKGLDYRIIGTTLDEKLIIINDVALKLDDLIEDWNSKLESVFPTKTDIDVEMQEIKPYNRTNLISPTIKTPKPKVLIPVFPGASCEYELEKAFNIAGAETEVLIVRNLSPAHIKESIKAIEKGIKNSQIVMFPGGMSGGDEPETAGKMVEAAFRSPELTLALADFIESHDGLILGIDGGFHTLIKLGLLPYGKYNNVNDINIALGKNSIGRHVATMATTKLVSTLSPWFTSCSLGDLHNVPVSSGQGAFIASDEVINELAENGQIATQYVDLSGSPSADIDWNPFGSYSAVESISSPDGRILGKMGFSERKGTGIHKDVVSLKDDQRIFESGVKYFK